MPRPPLSPEPDPTSTPREFDAFVKRHAWRNIALNTTDGVFWSMGTALAPVATVLPRFIGDCAARAEGLSGYENRLVGLLVLIMSVCYMMPQQVWAAGMTEGRPRLRRLFIVAAFFQRIPLLAMCVIAALAPRDPRLAVILLFVIMFAFQFLTGIASVIWLEMIARLTPPRRRGLLYGMRETFGALAALAVLLAAGRFVSRLDFPANYVLLFSGFFVFTFLATAPAFFLKEAPCPVQLPRRTFVAHLRDLALIVRNDTAFRRYFLSLAVYSIAGVATPSLFAVRAGVILGGDASLVLAINMTVVMTLARVSSIVIGPLGDRFGYRVLWTLASLFTAAGIACALLAFAPWGFYLAYVLSTLASVAAVCASNNYILEIASPDRRPSYISLNNMSGLPFVAVPLLGGWLADSLHGYAVPFLLGIAAALAAAACFSFIAVEPRERSGGAPA